MFWQSKVRIEKDKDIKLNLIGYGTDFKNQTFEYSMFGMNMPF